MKSWIRFGMLALLVGFVAVDANAIRIYFIGHLDPNLPRNSVYTDLMGGGLTMRDDNGQQITIPGLGYDVEFISENVDNPANAMNYDLVIAHESVNSGNVAMYVNLPVPYLAIEQIFAAGRADRQGGIWFSDAAGVQLPVGEFEFEIIDNTHPITRRYQQDEVIEITRSPNAQVAGILPDALAPGATPLAQSFLAPLRYTLVVADEGASGFRGNADAPVPAGADPAPARRAFLGYHEMVQVYNNDDTGIDGIALTREGAILYQRVIQWLVGNPVTADGTEGGTGIYEWPLH